MLQDLKTSTTDGKKWRLQRRVEEVKGQIQHYKGLVSKWESKATGYEKRLGRLEKEGECRT